MKLRELLHEAKINKAVITQDVDEGWKDTVGNLAIAGGIALGGGGALAVKDKLSGNYEMGSRAQTAQVAPAKQAPATAKTLAPKAAPTANKVASTPTKAAYTAANTANVKALTGNPLETVLLKTAKASGIAGTELAAFLAQCAHETLDFKALKEIGGSLDFRKYDPKYAPKKAKILGNVKPGDGAKYKGRGFIQLTGRDNYRKAGAQLGLPLEKHPEMVEDPKIAAQVAVWFWKHRVQPNVDNFNDVNAVTKMINPGMRGLEDRQDNFKNYMQVAMR